MTNAAPALLEHVNITVTDAKKTAKLFQDLFGWRVRWEGSALNDGYSVHVGTADGYVAFYSFDGLVDVSVRRHAQRGGLNHIGVVVDDLEATEDRIIAAGFKPRQHADYEPGKRFYFDADDGIEVEVVNYA